MLLEELAQYGLTSYGWGDVPTSNYECPECLVWPEVDDTLIGWCDASARGTRNPYGVFQCNTCGTKFMHHITMWKAVEIGVLHSRFIERALRYLDVEESKEADGGDS